MSFICQHTGVVVPSGIPQHKVVTEWRDTTYEKPVYKGRRQVGTKLVCGKEIVKEIAVSPEAYKQLTGLEPRLIDIKPLKTKITKKSNFNKPWKKFKNKNVKKTSSQQKKPIVEHVKTFSTNSNKS